MNLKSYFNSSPSLALEFFAGSIKSASLRVEKGKGKNKRKGNEIEDLIEWIELKSFGLNLEAAPASEASRESAREGIRERGNEISVTLLPASDLFFRQLEVPLTKERELQEALPFQAEPLLPFPLEECSISYTLLQKERDKTTVALLAYRQEAIAAHLKQCLENQIEPEAIIAPPLALAAFASVFRPECEVVLHVGDRELLCVAVSGKKPLYFAYSPIEEGSLTADKQFGKQFGKQFEEKEAIDKQKAVQTALKLFYATLKQSKIHLSGPLLITGEGALQLKSALEEVMQNGRQKGQGEIVLPLPFKEYSDQEIARYALCIGAAYLAQRDALEGDFRQGPFAYPHPWRKLKLPLTIFASLSLLLSLLIFLQASLAMQTQELAIHQTYRQLLQVMNKSASEVENDYRRKNHLPLVAEGSFDLAALESGAIADRATYLQQMKAEVEAFPLFPNIAQVSDVLAWLANHPQVMTVDKETGSQVALVQLESFHYTLIKRPAKGKTRDRYQVKVELEISCDTPHPAREFHTALVAPNDFIDPKAEIKWTANRGKYRAIFYLKDKTVYSL